MLLTPALALYLVHIYSLTPSPALPLLPPPGCVFQDP